MAIVAVASPCQEPTVNPLLKPAGVARANISEHNLIPTRQQTLGALEALENQPVTTPVCHW